MADRKENELTKANNFDYVRALDSNGNSIQISKSDLVSVLEELLKLNTMFLKTSNTVYGEGAAADANDFLNFQVYRYNSRTQNIPDNADGQILTITSFLNMKDRPVIQFAVTNSSTFYLRTKWYERAWSGWIKIN